jgi:hypothetical protein
MAIPDMLFSLFILVEYKILIIGRLGRQATAANSQNHVINKFVFLRVMYAAMEIKGIYNLIQTLSFI